MKARVKATGNIVDVVANENYYDNSDNKERYYGRELDFNDTADYWTRLEHTYAGMAMQGLLSSGKLNIIMDNSDVLPEGIAIVSRDFAHALVEKLKNESK